MEREQQNAGVIELGTASIDTLGSMIPTPQHEIIGWVLMGLRQD
jgi:hypothetical protein